MINTGGDQLPGIAKMLFSRITVDIFTSPTPPHLRTRPHSNFVISYLGVICINYSFPYFLHYFLGRDWKYPQDYKRKKE